ncbi:MAG: PKD domain-containing protein [Luteolibacter sp.]|nr:PKD domain-containing protein [Luteolibacter sp.]
MSAYRSFRSTVRHLVILVPLLLLAASVGILVFHQETRDAGPADSPARPVSVEKSRAADRPATASTEDSNAQAGFRQWIGAAEKSPAPRAERIAAGVALARTRRAHMERLIRENPEQAISESLTFAEWSALPPEVQALVEKPFSLVANYNFYPVCTAPGTARPAGTPDYFANITMDDGTKLEAFVYGRRSELMSKLRMPLQGVSLNGLAAIRDGVFQRIPAGELNTVRALFPASADMSRSFATGVPAGAEAVQALAGGRLFVFSNTAELESFDKRLAKLDALPGPAAASSVLAAPMPGTESGGFDWTAVETSSANEASAWTETKKTCYLIRINFPDQLAEPVTQAAADSVMNGPASDGIRAMSYGKTWMECGVSANVYTMPQNSTYYVNGGSGLNDELIRDGRNTFRTNKSGADAAINIGPVSNTGTGDSGGTGDYDIVGVFFGDVGMVSSNGVYYAGLAGGNRLWVQDANYPSLYIHEWGHNYGLSHASSWDTTDGSVVGTGASTEYGDIFDIMGGGPDPEGHFHPQGKSRLNWLTTSQWTDATAGGANVYRIHRIDDPDTSSSHSRGVRVTKAATPGSEEYYWLAYRPAFASNDHLQKGAYLNWQRPGQTKCWVLDTTPGTADGKKDGAIDLGRTYSDTAANIHITPTATGGTGANRYLDVAVNFGPFPSNTAPDATAIAGPSTVAARGSATYTASATDSNGDALAYWWDTQNGAVHENSASLANSWTVGGGYTLGVTVSDMKGGVETLTKSVTVTDPIDSWTQHSVGTTEDLKSVVWGKGRFIAAEYWGTIYQSWDGVTWSNVGDPPAFDSQPLLAFGADKFVIAGKKDGVSAAQICYSADGRVWSEAGFPAGVPQVRGITYGGGKFLAVADAGKVLSSTDGINWTLATVPEAPDFRHVAWDGNTWLAIALNASSQARVVWTSLDGAAWSQHSELGSSIAAVNGYGGVLYALGWYAGIKYSTDHGLTWLNAATPGTTRWSTTRIKMAEDGTLLALGTAMDESGAPDALLVSSDGIHWSRSTANGGNTAVANGNDLAFGAGCFLTVENGGITRSSGSFYPANSAPTAAFTANPSTVPARQGRLFASAAGDADGDSLVYAWDFGADKPIVDGNSTLRSFDFGGDYTATLRVSDGHGGLTVLTHNLTVTDSSRVFTQRTSGTTNSLLAVAANDTVAVAVGGTGGVIRTSTDGVTWTTRSVPEFGGNLTFRGAVWDGAKFIIVGTDYNLTAPAGWQGAIYTSPDGITWTRRYGSTNRNDDLQAVASDGTGAVAVGNSGTVLTSADGLTWSPVVIAGVAANLRGAAWNGSTYVIAGYAGNNGGATVFTSSNRSDWMDVTAGVGIDPGLQDLRKVAWLNDRFVSSGRYSKLRVSTDDAQTFTTTRTVNEHNPAMAYGDGIYFTAGEQLDAAYADVDVLSLNGVTWSSFTAPTTANRNGAVFFKHTFITVGAGGEIWQSGDTTPVSAGSNNAPTFAGHSATTPFETAATISFGTLLAASGDLDGDALAITAASPASAHGGSSGLLSDSIRYSPPAGFSGNDTISITITDARGATVQATVTFTVGAIPGATILNPPTITLLPGNGEARLDFTGDPDQTYEIQRSVDLTSWSVIAAPTAAPDGTVSFTDPSPPPGKAFYRIRQP